MVCLLFFTMFIIILLRGEYFGSREAINDRIKLITRLKQDDIDDKKEGFWNYIWYKWIWIIRKLKLKGGLSYGKGSSDEENSSSSNSQIYR